MKNKVFFYLCLSALLFTCLASLASVILQATHMWGFELPDHLIRIIVMVLLVSLCTLLMVVNMELFKKTRILTERKQKAIDLLNHLIDQTEKMTQEEFEKIDKKLKDLEH